MLTAWKDEKTGVIFMTEGPQPIITFFDVSKSGSKQLERTKCEWVIYEKLKEELED